MRLSERLIITPKLEVKQCCRNCDAHSPERSILPPRPCTFSRGSCIQLLNFQSCLGSQTATLIVQCEKFYLLFVLEKFDLQNLFARLTIEAICSIAFAQVSLLFLYKHWLLDIVKDHWLAVECDRFRKNNELWTAKPQIVSNSQRIQHEIFCLFSEQIILFTGPENTHHVLSFIFIHFTTGRRTP